MGILRPLKQFPTLGRTWIVLPLFFLTQLLVPPASSMPASLLFPETRCWAEEFLGLPQGMLPLLCLHNLLLMLAGFMVLKQRETCFLSGGSNPVLHGPTDLGL